MDRSTSNAAPAPAGISVRNGPVTEAMDVDEPMANGKRKARISGVKPKYADSESEEDAKPLVCDQLQR
jgi:DNA topoisomerase-1